MRFLTMVKMNDEQVAKNPPPPELMAACNALAEEGMKEGVVLELGGLRGLDAGAEVRVRDGRVTVLDGPYAEAKEVIGGYAILEVRSKDEAVERARRLMQLHADLWPGFDGSCEVRQYQE
jgi:hypothetical protein